MTLDRLVCEQVFRAAVEACLPERFVKLRLRTVSAGGRFVYGLALGNAAISMLRGAGPVMHGIAITRDDDRLRIPKGWAVHAPDATAATAILDLIATATSEDVIVLLLSAGAEQILPPELQRGGLARLAAGRVIVMIASDRRDDRPDELAGAPFDDAGDAHVVTPSGLFAGAIQTATLAHHTQVELLSPMPGDQAHVADLLASEVSARGYPVLYVQARGHGGARSLAIELARAIAGTSRHAFVAASSGWDDGPARAGHPRPAGAFVDGDDWAVLEAAGDRLDALHGIGALVVTQLTGIDYGGDIVIVG